MDPRGSTVIRREGSGRPGVPAGGRAAGQRATWAAVPLTTAGARGPIGLEPDSRISSRPGRPAMDLDLGPEIAQYRAELRDWISAEAPSGLAELTDWNLTAIPGGYRDQ